MGKVDNCVVGQHLLYTDNNPANPFCCVLASDLYLPESWVNDRARCREAGIPDDLNYRPKWRIGIDAFAGFNVAAADVPRFFVASKRRAWPRTLNRIPRRKWTRSVRRRLRLWTTLAQPCPD